ncbi:MAG: hypothetical protein WAV38_16390, partial [Xanthobacteraceae bacterium]
SHPVYVGTVVACPPIFVVRTCAAFPLGIGIIFDVFASEAIGASSAVAVSKQSETLRTRVLVSSLV